MRLALKPSTCDFGVSSPVSLAVHYSVPCIGIFGFSYCYDQANNHSPKALDHFPEVRIRVFDKEPTDYPRSLLFPFSLVPASDFVAKALKNTNCMGVLSIFLLCPVGSPREF